jgi:Lon protease-like protein
LNLGEALVSAMSDPSLILEHFDGTVPLFPLPNVVLFPHVVQPLHIFELRYRQMTSAALAGDRLIAQALLQPGWEGDYEGRPPIHPVVCIGKIDSEQRLADGRFNLLLRGLSRARVVEEIAQDKLYRVARVELLTDGPPPSAQVDHSLRQQLAEAMRSRFPEAGEAQEQLRKLLDSNLPLGVLCDIFSFAVPLPVEAKQGLLADLQVERRLRTLLGLLTNATLPAAPEPVDRRFPPEFSSN